MQARLQEAVGSTGVAQKRRCCSSQHQLNLEHAQLHVIYTWFERAFKRSEEGAMQPQLVHWIGC